MDGLSSDQPGIREAVRDRYAAAARAASRPDPCCESAALDQGDVFGRALYGPDDRQEVPQGALDVSLGCGNPTAVADLYEGETVLDLGSGSGTDLLLSARRVGPTGKVYGLDMTDEMLDLARANVREAGVENVELIKGYIEEVPLADETVDVVISNCVINLSADKRRVFVEAARVLRPGGRLAVSDVLADDDLDPRTRADMQSWTGCIAGALTAAEFTAGLHAAGFDGVQIRETHRVHDGATSAIIRAHRPAAGRCCDASAQDECCEPAAKPGCCGSEPDPASCGCSGHAPA